MAITQTGLTRATGCHYLNLRGLVNERTQTNGLPSWELNGQHQPEMNEWGMELRDWFAGQVIAGSFSGTCGSTPTTLAKEAYAIADAMMEVRKQ